MKRFAMIGAPILFALATVCALVMGARTPPSRLTGDEILCLGYFAVSPTTYDVTGAGPTVIVLHGGGGVSGDRRMPLTADLSRRLTNAGFRVVNMDYTPGSVSFARRLGEVRAMVMAVSAKAPVFLVGVSYGALLAELVAAEKPERIRGVVALAGVHDTRNLSASWVAEATQGESPRPSAIAAVRHGFPPTLIIHGDRDRQVPVSQAAAMAGAIRHHSGTVTLRIFEGYDHTNGLSGLYPAAYPDILAWLKSH